ncbi:protein trichome birefringence-like 2 [Juglans microcarpa x Juglans regia]|uniref:protein trichome birefringence-like 2 n=1 Tax=Juglans microcarpa x Juglans regia TaxID=2249226 RepID=UPI001B7E2FFD|nr:protein trichome birefringence-like 2 [Juglans microcarpa x Juglans regia]
MDMKKLPFSEPFQFPRRKIASGFGLGVGISLVVLVALFLNNSLKIPTGKPLLQGFEGPLPLASTANFSYFSPSNSSTNATSELQNSVDLMQWSEEGKGPHETHGENVSGISKKEGLEEANVGGLGSIHSVNFTETLNNGSFSLQETNGSLAARSGDSLGSEGVVLGKFSANSSESLKNESVLGQEGSVIVNLGLSDKDADSEKKKLMRNSSNWNSVTEKNNVSNFSHNGVLGNAPSREETVTAVNRADNWDEYGSSVKRMDSGSYETCDIFDGRWVRDDTKPYYPAGSCPHIDKDFDCHLNGRPDDGYVKWRWQPNGCNIPSLNATDFLERLRGKRLVFVGDSLNRNMWESMVCILRQSVRNKARVYEISGKREFKKKGIYAFRFEDYNCSVDFVSSPFLVRESSFNGRNGSFETLRLDLMDKTTSMYHDADVIVFNTGHWWTHEKTSRGENYYQEGNYVHPRLKVLKAYTRALTTWARWIDKNVDANQTQVFFRGYSVTHFRGGQWNSGGRCHKETEPIFNQTFLAKYPSKMRALEHVLLETKSPVLYLNISRLTDYRKDGHPSIHRMEYKTVEERIAAERSQDCSHWCLPGVPDTWNELLYASLLKAGKGSWKN